MTDLNTILDVDDLHIDIAAPGGRAFSALQGVSLQIRAGEIVGVVGESGSGSHCSPSRSCGFCLPWHGWRGAGFASGRRTC